MRGLRRGRFGRLEGRDALWRWGSFVDDFGLMRTDKVGIWCVVVKSR